MQDLLAARFWIGIGGGILAAATPTGMTAILLFPVRGMPIAHESLTATMRTVKGDGDHRALLFFHFSSVLRIYHILLACATTPIPSQKKVITMPIKRAAQGAISKIASIVGTLTQPR